MHLQGGLARHSSIGGMEAQLRPIAAALAWLVVCAVTVACGAALCTGLDVGPAGESVLSLSGSECSCVAATVLQTVSPGSRHTKSFTAKGYESPESAVTRCPKARRPGERIA